MGPSDDKTAKCSHCGYPLSPAYVGPCPNCGKTGKTIAVHISARAIVDTLNIQQLVNTSAAGTFSAYNIPTPNWWPEASKAITLDITHEIESKLPELLAQHDREIELKGKRWTNRLRGIGKELFWIVVGIVLGPIILWLFLGP